MKKYLFIIILFLICSKVFAGQGFYVTFENNSSRDINIFPAGNDNWYPNDLGNSQIVPSGTKRTFYTEQKGFSDGIVGVDTSFGHVEIWKGDHNYSVTHNIKHLGVYFVGANTPFIATYISKDFDSYYINIIFREAVSLDPKIAVPYNEKLFTVEKYSVSKNIKGLTIYNTNNLAIPLIETLDDNKSDFGPNNFLIENKYDINHGKDDEKTKSLLQHAKYSMIGSLHFYYISDNQNYECKNIGLVANEDKKGNFVWGVISNIAPGQALYQSSSKFNFENISVKDLKITCSNVDSLKPSLFNVSINAVQDDVDVRNISRKLVIGLQKIDKNDKSVFLNDIINSYNAHSLRDKETNFSNNIYHITDVSDFFVFDPKLESINFDQISAYVDNYKLESMELLWQTSSYLPNSTGVNQTNYTQPQQVTYSDQETTSTTKSQSYATTIHATLKNVFSEAGVSFSAEFSNSTTDSTTTSKSSTYTTPSEPIFTPPGCVANVKQTLYQYKISGTYITKYVAQKDTNIKVNGIIYMPNRLPIYYNEGFINLYDALENTNYQSEQIFIDRNNKTVTFVGGGVFNAQLGTHYDYSYFFTQLEGSPYKCNSL